MMSFILNTPYNAKAPHRPAGKPNASRLDGAALVVRPQDRELFGAGRLAHPTAVVYAFHAPGVKRHIINRLMSLPAPPQS